MSTMSDAAIEQMLAVLWDLADHTTKVLRCFQKAPVMQSKTVVAMNEDVENILLRVIGKMTHLREIYLGGPSGGFMTQLINMFPSLPLLSVLHAPHVGTFPSGSYQGLLTTPAELTDWMPNLIEKGTNITDLDISFCERKGKPDLTVIPTLVKMTQLKGLSIQHYTYVTGVGYSFLRGKLPNLVRPSSYII